MQLNRFSKVKTIMVNNIHHNVDTVINKLQSLIVFLIQQKKAAVAVSGGIDSILLAYLGSKYMEQCEIYHSVSSAAPEQATLRVKQYTEKYNWNLIIVDSHEFINKNYISNPVNRCYYCKSSLYDTIKNHTTLRIFSGTNIDDLNDYRPGLKAAQENGVMHPFVVSGIDKKMIRSIAYFLRLHDICNLPASPCLSSRIESHIRIDANLLPLINQVELYLTNYLNAQIVRCRIRSTGIHIELDKQTYEHKIKTNQLFLVSKIREIFSTTKSQYSIYFDQYKMGSAFLNDKKEVLKYV